MKLVIQIPCLNEAESLPGTLADLPRTIPGIEVIEILLLDDGSSDASGEVARRAGVHHVLRMPRQQGLARLFMAGLAESVRLGADVIVNFDADNQYRGEDIPRLIAPILRGEADLVIGDRAIGTLEHFSATKRALQRFGSWVVRKVSGTDVPDATSGFRALSREAALRMNVVTEFTYTLETIIQAGKQRLALAHIPIQTNVTARPSRLFSSVGEYTKRSAASILRLYTHYEPLKTFTRIGAAFLGVGGILGLRFVYYWALGEGQGKVQSLILAAVLLIVGVQVVLMGVIGDIIAANRRLLEELLYRQRKQNLGGPPSDGRHGG